MKGTFFAKPLEWNIETIGESWHQGDVLKGTLKVRNHGSESIDLHDTGVSIAFADIKKVQTRADGALKPDATIALSDVSLQGGSEISQEFSFNLSDNGPVSDKKSSYYLCFGKKFIEGQLQLKVNPKELYSKIVSLLDTFHRFKMKEYKTTKKGVEFKLVPPTSRDMANIESLFLTFSMIENHLSMKFDFHIKRLDTSGVTTKINKETVSIVKSLAPKEYSLGKDMINQDLLLKSIEQVLSDVKMKAVF